MIPFLMRVDILLLAAGVASVGVYACKLWEKSLRLRQQEIYVHAFVQCVEAISQKRAYTAASAISDRGRRVSVARGGIV